MPKCGKTWRLENALQKWRNLRNCTLLRNLYVAKRNLLTSFKAQEAQTFYDFFKKKFLIMDWKINTCDCLNNCFTSLELEELVDFKKNKNKKKTKRLSDTFCVGRSAFLFFFYWAYKDQKNQTSLILKYHNHTLQTKTRPDIIIHFIKQWDQFHFECNCMRKNVCPFQYLLFPTCHTAHELFCCLLRRHTTNGEFHSSYGWCGIRCSFQCMQWA